VEPEDRNSLTHTIAATSFCSIPFDETRLRLCFDHQQQLALHGCRRRLPASAFVFCDISHFHIWKFLFALSRLPSWTVDFSNTGPISGRKKQDERPNRSSFKEEFDCETCSYASRLLLFVRC
jgi:hypothetical protein